jgi:phosphoglycolate phosphatase
MFRLYVFDLDGTLVDSRRDIAHSANLLLESSGAPPLPEGDIGRMVGEGAAVLVARAFAAAGVVPPGDALGRFLAIYDQHLLDHTRPYEGVLEVLEAIGRRASTAVLTNKPLAATRRILDGLGLARHFRAGSVVAGDGPQPRKPNPTGLRHLMSLSAVDAASTLLVGDSTIDWRTAREARVPLCLARYGFGFELFPIGELTGEERLIDDPRQLLEL